MKKKNSKKIEHLQGNGHLWKTKLYESDKQNDGYNCGVFVMLYNEAILKDPDNIKLTDLKNPDDFQHDIKEIILNNSDSVLGICLYCNRRVDVSITPKCTVCDRSICQTCSNRKKEMLNRRCWLCHENIW